MEQNLLFRRAFRLNLQPAHAGQFFQQGVLCVKQRRLGDQPAHTVPEQDHFIEGCFCFGCLRQFHLSIQNTLAEKRGGIEKGVAAGIGKEPELAVLTDHRIIFERVDHLHPRVGAGHETVDQYHGNLVRIVRFQRIESRRGDRPGGIQHIAEQVHIGQGGYIKGERRGIIENQRNVFLACNLDGAYFVIVVKLESRMEGVRFAGGAPETQEHGRAVSDR